MTTHLHSDMDSLLHKLSSDDVFRARLLGDPVAALGSLGITLAPGQIPAERSLPAKDAIALDRMAFMSKLDSAAGAIPFFLSGTA
ncbi:putative modified peptide [Massilia atriviolacea]|uniref:Putative modified peptide n=1 Tax=Massilia atriviolacea TaxID=2495579 RepID=A0A430HT49_9BURK|nr:NHLP-related RiPP peptide [Massilia atriviolacea]RSZ60733.1 putative modified peptide [Massilia atriviolacea]